MADTSAANQGTEQPKKSLPRRIWQVVVAILTFFGLLAPLVAAYGYFSEPDIPTRVEASAFIGWYYQAAPHSPDATWSRTTKAWRHSQAQNPDKPGNIGTYRNYWYTFKTSKASDIAPIKDSNGRFKATITWVDQTGRTRGPAYLDIEVVCPKYTKLPFTNCTRDNMQLNDTRFARV